MTNQAHSSNSTQDLRSSSTSCMCTAIMSGCLAILLAIVTGLSIKGGPYLDIYEDRHRQVEPFSLDVSPLGRYVAEVAPERCLKIDASRPYTPTPAEISQLPAAEGIIAFSFNPNLLYEPSLTAEDEQAITEALSYFTDRNQTCSCLVVNLTTGYGIGFNYEKRVYGASAFKGIVSAYVCEELIDGGKYELEGSLKNLIEDTVVHSNNDTFRTLRSGYASGLEEWVDNLGIDPSYVTLYRFPTYNAQESTALWAHVAEYLDSDGEAAVWLGETFTRTNVSHIRAAVERGIESGELFVEDDVTVQNKAGWIAARANSTTDAGLVHINGHVYAISIMSDAPDSPESRSAVSDVALALLVAMQ